MTAVNGNIAPESDKAFPATWRERILSVSDLDDLCAFEDKCFISPWSRQQLKCAFDHPAFTALAFFHPSAAENIIAYASFYHVAPEMEILKLAVDPALRRCGCGHNLLGAALSHGKRLGLSMAFLEVNCNNDAAIALYRKNGFMVTGSRRCYYTETGDDALVMSRTF